MGGSTDRGNSNRLRERTVQALIIMQGHHQQVVKLYEYRYTKYLD